MRHARLKAEGTGYYHVVSRIVDRNFRLDNSEKEIFRKMMRKAEAFSGVRVLTYAILANHFHLLIEVPERGEVDETELFRRVTALYGKVYATSMVKQWAEWRQLKADYLVEEQQHKLRQRMGDISAFVKTLKQRYSISYNSRHDRKGTLWEERFRSVLIEDGERAKATVAAYIDLNPVRAKIVTDPKDYRWSGYGEACGGNKIAREGLALIHGTRHLEQPGVWRHVSKRYRILLYTAGEEHRTAYDGSVIRKGFTAKDVDTVITRNGKLPLPEVLRCRVRYFTDGLAFGGKAFVNWVFTDNRSFFSPDRKEGARKMRGGDWGDLCVARALRIEPVSVPLTT